MAKTSGEKAKERVERIGTMPSRQDTLPQEVKAKVTAKVHMIAMMKPMPTSEAPRASRGVKAAARRVAPKVKERKVAKAKKRQMLTRWMMNWTNTSVRNPLTGMPKIARKASHWTVS